MQSAMSKHLIKQTKSITSNRTTTRGILYQIPKRQQQTKKQISKLPPTKSKKYHSANPSRTESHPPWITLSTASSPNL